MNLFSLQGYVNLAALDASGNIGAMRWVGNVPEATLELDVSEFDKEESFSGSRLLIGTLPGSVKANLNITLDYWSSPNLAQAFQASVAQIAASTASAEAFPAGLVAGDLVRLDHPFVSGLVITDSAGAPVTVDPADYALEGHSESRVRIIDPAAYTQPFKAAYSYDAAENIVLFSQPSKYVYAQFDGINTETGEPVLIDLWKTRFSPVKSLGLINQEYGNLQLSGKVLYDTTRAGDAALGGFGRMQQKPAA